MRGGYRAHSRSVPALPWSAVTARCLVVSLVCASTIARAQAPEPPPPDATPAPIPVPVPIPIPVQAPTPVPAPTPAAEPPAPEPAPLFKLPALEVHGFVSEGGFLSTANDYIGKSSRGSLKLFEAGLNVSTELADRLRAGLQLYGRDVGAFQDLPPRLDWAFIDYRWKRWLGLRAGIIKMPFGLYNEYADIDSARTAILMPQSVYSLQNRSALLAHTGFALYGERALGGAGTLEYQAWLGTLNVPENALEVGGATLDEVDTKYITGAQVFWRPPVEGLRIGATYLRASIDFRLTLDPALVAQAIMLGLVPPDYDGKLVISQRPDTLLIGSAEYVRGDWLVAAEYSRWFKRQIAQPMLQATLEEDAERFYVLATRRLSEHVELGGYVSVLHADADDRRGRDKMQFAKSYFAFQRDYAASVRFDVNEHWLWKVEAHFIDGAADLPAASNPDPKRYWGMFLLRTTVTF